MTTKVVAIVPAAGFGKRFGANDKKQFIKIGDNPLFLYPLQVLHSVQSIAEIIPVVQHEDMERCRNLIETALLDKIRVIAPGGEKRQDSVRNGLDHVRGDCLVLIHDGARPLLSRDLVERLLHEAPGRDGVVPGISVRDTLKKIDSQGHVLSTVRREDFWSIQTPQVFPYRFIRRAYDKAYADGFYGTDDAVLVERAGGQVKVIAGDPLNIKVTTPEDMLIVAHAIDRGRKSKPA